MKKMYYAVIGGTIALVEMSALEFEQWRNRYGAIYDNREDAEWRLQHPLFVTDGHVA